VQNGTVSPIPWESGSRLAKQSLPNLTGAVHLVLHPEAQAEILEAADWYDLQDVGLGDEFLAEVDAAIDESRSTGKSGACELTVAE
jgi:hypothetical protein